MARKPNATKTSTKKENSAPIPQAATPTVATPASKPTKKLLRARKVSVAKKPTPKPAGPGKRYSPALKSAIMSAAIAARGSGKSWAEALQAAKAKGYRGKLQALVKMIRTSNRKKKVIKQTTKRGPGRPKGSAKRRNTPAMSISTNGFGSIQAAVDRIVSKRVAAALKRAIAVLESSI